MLKKIVTLPIITLISFSCSDDADHSRIQTDKTASLHLTNANDPKFAAPIIHTGLLKHEPQTLGYSPGFEANPVSFDKRNRAYMLTMDAKLQIIQDNGTWKIIDIAAQVKKSLLTKGIAWDGVYRLSRISQNTIVFDDMSDAYMLFDASTGTMTSAGKKVSSGMLLHSKDRGENWTAYPIPTFTSGKGARLEFRDGHNKIASPPAILLYGKGEYLVDARTNRLKNGGGIAAAAHTTAQIILPAKNSDGTLNLNLNRAIEVTKKGIFADLHSGVGNTMISVGDKLHIVYIAFNDIPMIGENGVAQTAAPCVRGTPTYISTVTKSSFTIGLRQFLGCAGEYDSSIHPIPDVHNHPAITIDSKQFLHLVLGSHHDNFLYRKSTKPADATAWSAPVEIGEQKRDPRTYEPSSRNTRVGSYTYVGLLCDAKDKLHVVARWAGVGYTFRLVSMTKNALEAANGPWDEYSDSYSKTFYPKLSPTQFNAEDKYKHHHLVVPSQPGYVVYHHKLTTDRYGRIYLAYETQEKEMTGAMAAEYCRMWPSDCNASGVLEADPGQADCHLPTKRCKYYDNTKAHDPVLMMSNNSGKSWRLVNTLDLQSVIIGQ